MKYFIDRSIIANKLFPGINTWTSFSDILTSIFATDTTVLPTATTTVSGIVELATTEETSLGSDDTKAVTPASLAPYGVAIAAAGWTNGGATSSKAITGATHGKGILPKVSVFNDNGTSYVLLSSTYSVVKANGNLTITIATTDVPTNGFILVY